MSADLRRVVAVPHAAHVRYRETATAEFRRRMDELRPVVEEARRLTEAIAALDVALAEHARHTHVRQGRPAQTLAIVRSCPGLTVEELADVSDIPLSTLRGMLPTLRYQGVLVQRRHRWYEASPRRR